MDDKKLKGLIDEVKAVGEAGKDMASSDELRSLESAIKEETAQLKGLAEGNEKLNAIQLAVDIAGKLKESKSNKKAQETADKNLAELKEEKASQLKRDKGGKAAREIILEQNKMTLEGLNRIEKTLALMSKQDGRGGTAGAPSGKPGPKPTGPKTQADKDVEQAAKNIKEVSEKDKALANKTTIAGSGEKLDTKAKRKGFGMSDEDYARQYERDQAAKRREGSRRDELGLSNKVETTGDSLNKRKLSANEFGQEGALGFGEDEELKIGGKRIVRAGQYKTGTAKFKDADTNKFTATDPIKALAEDVRISQGVVGTTRNSRQNQGSKAAGLLNKNIGANAGEIQKALEANESAKADLNDVITALGNLQLEKDPLKQKSVQADIQGKVEKLKLSGGEELSKNLGLQEVQDQARGREGIMFGSSAFKTFAGINQGTGFDYQGVGDKKFLKGEGKLAGVANKVLNKGVQFGKNTLGVAKQSPGVVGGALSEMFTADRIFGTAGTGKLSNVGFLQGKKQFEEKGLREQEEQSQGEAQGRMMGTDTGLGIYDGTKGKEGKKIDPDTGFPIFDESKKDEWRDKNIPQENRDGSVAKASEENIAELEKTADNTEATAEDIATLTKEATTEGSIFTHDTHLEEKFDELADAIKGKDERTGQDTESFAEKQLDTLEQMLQSLQNIEAAGMGGGGDESGGGMMDTLMGRRKKKGGKRGGRKPKGRFAKLASKGGGLLRGAARFAGPLAGLAAVGTAAYGGFKEFNKTDEFGVEGKDASLGMKAASATGGALSALTFGLADADSISKGIYGKTGDQTLEALKEKDPELAARIEKRVAQGENIDDVIQSEDANIKEAGVDDRGFFSKAFDMSPVGMIKNAITDATTTTDLEAGMDQAKESGLYDENFFGESTIDKEKLKDASISQLKAIIKDDDLTNEDMQLVKDTLEEKRNAKAEMVQKLESGTLDQTSLNEAGIESEGNKTALAVENMGRLSGEATDMANAQPQPVIVNNNSTSAPASGKSDDKLIGVMGSPGIRNNDSTIHRAMDRRFT